MLSTISLNTSTPASSLMDTSMPTAEMYSYFTHLGGGAQENVTIIALGIALIIIVVMICCMWFWVHSRRRRNRSASSDQLFQLREQNSRNNDVQLPLLTSSSRREIPAAKLEEEDDTLKDVSSIESMVSPQLQTSSPKQSSSGERRCSSLGTLPRRAPLGPRRRLSDPLKQTGPPISVIEQRDSTEPERVYETDEKLA